MRWVIATGKSIDRAVSDSKQARQSRQGRAGKAGSQSEEGATVAASTQDAAIANSVNSCQNSLSLCLEGFNALRDESILAIVLNKCSKLDDKSKLRNIYYQHVRRASSYSSPFSASNR